MLNILEAEISTHIPEKMHVAAVLTPLQDEVTGSSRTPLLILLAAVVAVLLIVCVNLANLALARGAARARDVAIRRALGATPWQTLRATLVESLCLGIYGVVSWSVTRRRNEIGIRMALGAGSGRVRRMIVGEGMRPVLVGLGAGLLAAWLLGRVVSGLLFAVSPHDGWTMAAVSGVLAAVSAAVCYLPARRVTRADPLRALRYE